MHANSQSIFSGRIIVLFPDLHISGGPHCLHALHSELNELGVESSMWAVNEWYAMPNTRVFANAVGQPFPCRNMHDIKKYWPYVREELQRTLSPSDILVLPMMYDDYLTTDELKTILESTGARSAVYLLGVAFPRDPTEQDNNRPGVVVGYDTETITRGISQILPLSHYIHQFHGLPHNDDSSVLLSPMESKYYHAAREWRDSFPSIRERIDSKEDLILVDDDSGSFTLTSEFEDVSRFKFVVLTGFTGDQLISLYKRAKCIIDLRLNGPERTVWEGALFDAVPLVAVQGNGADDVDIPIPREFKIDAREGYPQHKRLTTQLKKLLLNYDRIIGENVFESFRAKVVNLPAKYSHAVFTTFSSASLHFVLGTGAADLAWEETLHCEAGQIASLLSILHSMPLARVTIKAWNPLVFVRSFAKVFRELSALGLSDAQGGKRFHSIRVVGADADEEFEKNSGNVLVKIPGPGNVLFLGVETIYKIAACIQ